MSREHHAGCIPSLTMSPWLSSAFGVTSFMKTSCLAIAIACFAITIAIPADYIRADGTENTVRRGDWMRANGMLACLASGDYETFCGHGPNTLAENVTREKFEELSKEYGPRLRKGFHLDLVGVHGREGRSVVIFWTVFWKGQGRSLLRVSMNFSAGEALDIEIEE
jgi:hypothetical protein